MNKQIKKLKNLRILHECALNFDLDVPEKEQAEELLMDYLPDYINIEKEDLEELLEEYEGWSVSNIEEAIFNVIDEL